MFNFKRKFKLTSGAELFAVILGKEIVEVTTLSEVTELDTSSFSGVVVESWVSVSTSVRNTNIEVFAWKTSSGVVDFRWDSSVSGADVEVGGAALLESSHSGTDVVGVVTSIVVSLTVNWLLLNSSSSVTVEWETSVTS